MLKKITVEIIIMDERSIGAVALIEISCDPIRETIITPKLVIEDKLPNNNPEFSLPIVSITYAEYHCCPIVLEVKR